jgi:hypothetical protein
MIEDPSAVATAGATALAVAVPPPVPAPAPKGRRRPRNKGLRAVPWQNIARFPEFGPGSKAWLDVTTTDRRPGASALGFPNLGQLTATEGTT